MVLEFSHHQWNGTVVIKVGARSSPLSRVQVQEVYQEILQYHPSLEFQYIFVETTGDKDRVTSLRTLDKTDFFTKEIDHLLLKGECRLAIHSAKDLPDPLPQGLVIAAITKGVDSADVLVLRPGMRLDNLRKGALIATSSYRREEQVKQLRSDLKFRDLRGTIQERLGLLEQEEVDGIVVAEAALIRLGLTHLNRIRLPGDTVLNQGKLAILCRKDDSEMLELFDNIDSRQKKILYLGLNLPEKCKENRFYIHYPIIHIQFRSSENQDIQESFKNISKYTHLLFTSKSAVHAFFQNLSYFGYKNSHISDKEVICVGQQTAQAMKAYGTLNVLISPIETAEGITALLQDLSHQNPYFFWPHSALSRPIISDYLRKRRWLFKECVIYDTLINRSLKPVDLNSIDEIHFTSPSTVDAFLELFESFPQDKVLRAIGPITHQIIYKPV